MDAVQQGEGGVRQGEHERELGAEHPVDLAEHAVEVRDVGQRGTVHHQVDGVGPYERQLGEVALVQLDLDLLVVGGRPHRGRGVAGTGRR